MDHLDKLAPGKMIFNILDTTRGNGIRSGAGEGFDLAQQAKHYTATVAG